MSHDLTIGGVAEFEASSYTVAEDATPLTIGDMTGGVGQITFEVPQLADTKRMRGKTVVLADDAQGTTTGIVSKLGGDGFNATATAKSRMANLAVTRTALPQSGTLESALLYYLGLVDITSGIVIDESLKSLPVAFVGWNGVVWDNIKKLCAALEIEASLVSNNVVFRLPRTRIAETTRDSSIAWDIDESNQAQSIEILYYLTQNRSSGLAYPLGGWSDEFQPISVDAGAKVEQTFSLDPGVGEEGLGASLVSIQQPVVVDSVAREYGATSVYSIVGNDGYPITAAQWRAGGGKVSVEILEDTRSIKVTVVAPVDPEYAPYRLAMPSGPSDFYSSLRLVGTGAFFTKEKLTLVTGLSGDRAPEVIGETIDNEFVTSKEQAFRRGAWALAKWTGPSMSINVATTGINRKGDSGSYAYPLIRDHNTVYAGRTIAQYNAIWGGKTIADVNQFWKDYYADDFVNQAFGNVGGARTLYEGLNFRINSVSSITPSGISYSAVLDTTVRDFNDRYAGKSIAEINALTVGLSIGHANLALLDLQPNYNPSTKWPYPGTFYPDQLYPA